MTVASHAAQISKILIHALRYIDKEGRTRARVFLDSKGMLQAIASNHNWNSKSHENESMKKYLYIFRVSDICLVEKIFFES